MRGKTPCLDHQDWSFDWLTMNAAPITARAEQKTAPAFRSDASFLAELHNLFVWRRDERHFRTDAVPDDVLQALIAEACLAPSVGNAQPWRFVDVRSPARRLAVIENFESANAAAAMLYEGARADAYLALKLAGLREAPVHLAVFCDENPVAGHGLGRHTMPEMLRYSVVCAVHTLWLAAQARGLGVGWVSILDANAVGNTLEVPEDWALVAYLCIGWPRQSHAVPELESQSWQSRLAAETFVQTR
jgi:5,6-dimethylbenzimidazole synthase